MPDATVPDPVADVAEEIDRKVVDSPWIEKLARMGYAAKGVIYLTVGVLALRAAAGVGSADADSKDALLTLAQGGMGTFILVALIVGLVGYILWRLYQAWKDTENKGDDAPGLAKRAGYVGSALFYGGILLSAVQILRGLHPSGESGAEDWTATLLSHGWGEWLVALAGAILVVVGAAELWRGVSSRFREEVDEAEMSEKEQALFLWVGRAGLAARGLLYAMTGVFLIQAAWRHDPEEAGGLGEALAELAGSSVGSMLFVAVSLGLVAYGLYALAQARYRRFDTV